MQLWNWAMDKSWEKFQVHDRAQVALKRLGRNIDGKGDSAEGSD